MTSIVASKAPSLLVGIVAVLILASEIEPRKLDTPKIRLAKTPQSEPRPESPKPSAAAVPMARLQLPPAPVRVAISTIRRSLIRSFMAGVDRPRAATIARVCELRLDDPNLSAAEKDRIRVIRAEHEV